MGQKFRHAAIHVALAAMLLRALLPAGWMPNAAPTGPWLTICTGDADVQSGHDKQAPADAAHAHDECPFAAAPHLAAPASAASIALASYAGMAPMPAGSRLLIAPVAGYLPQSPRAPPVSV